MSIGPNAEDRAVLQRARRREREAAVCLQQWFRRRQCNLHGSRRHLRSRHMVLWREAISDDGSVFYYNIEDKRAQWEAPAKYLSLQDQHTQSSGMAEGGGGGVLAIASPDHHQSRVLDLSPVHQQVRAITRAIHAEVVASKTVHSTTLQHTAHLEKRLQELETKVARDEAAIRAEEAKAERERVREVQKNVKPSAAVRRALTRDQRSGGPTLAQYLALAARVYAGLACNKPDGKVDLGDPASSKVR